MAKIDYDLIEPGIPFTVKLGQVFHLICCDCNLAHDVKIGARRDGKVEITITRDDKATKSLRISEAKKKRSRKPQ